MVLVPFLFCLVPTGIKYPDRKCEYHSGQISFDLPEIWWLWWATGLRSTVFNEFKSFGDDLEKNTRFRRLSKSEISPEKLKSGRPVKLVSGFFTLTIGFPFVPSLELQLIQVQIRRRQVMWLARSCGTPYLKTKKIKTGVYLNVIESVVDQKRIVRPVR